MGILFLALALCSASAAKPTSFRDAFAPAVQRQQLADYYRARNRCVWSDPVAAFGWPSRFSYADDYGSRLPKERTKPKPNIIFPPDPSNSKAGKITVPKGST